jgi:hypothetical protein
MSKSFSVADVATHKDAESGMYIIIDENVYDVAGLSPFPFLPIFRSIMGASPQTPVLAALVLMWTVDRVCRRTSWWG